MPLPRINRFSYSWPPGCEGAEGSPYYLPLHNHSLHLVRAVALPIHVIDSNHVEHYPFIIAAISMLSHNYAQLFSDSKMRRGGRKPNSSGRMGHVLEGCYGRQYTRFMALTVD